MKWQFAAVWPFVFLLLLGQYGYAEGLTDGTSAMQALVGMGILKADFLEGEPEISRGEFTRSSNHSR